MDKKRLRREISTQKKMLSQLQIAAASARLAERFFACDAYRNADSVYAYLSYNQEILTDSIIRRALADGKRVAVPKIIDGEMVFLWIDDLSQVATGFYGIREPIADGPVADDEAALILMPGLAFDPEGHRIGYGGGYYDRYLSKHPRHKLIALCYDFQLVEHLETEAHDIPVQLVLCDER